MVCCPTVCVSGGWAGVDNVWDVEKPEARKLLVNRADSQLSAARGVRREFEDSTFCCRQTCRHNKRKILFQARDETNLKNESPHEKQRATNDKQKPKRYAQNKNHKVKNFAYTASQSRLPKDDRLQNEAAKKTAQDTYINFGKLPSLKNTWQAMNLAKRLTAA